MYQFGTRLLKLNYNKHKPLESSLDTTNVAMQTIGNENVNITVTYMASDIRVTGT